MIHASAAKQTEAKYSPQQLRFFAEVLKPEDTPEREVTRALANARVRMNPHQVDAALFALQSPLSRGVLLADEVGLGKTIEAGLVMAQQWAERRRLILVIVPATLRKQWETELWDKFGLPSRILDADAARKLGQPNPFTSDAPQQAAIVICSYEFAGNRAAQLETVPWHLVVFDEAHKLRNVWKAGESVSKRAKKLRDATSGAERRMLLSATPMQNSLMELYGLVSVIDDEFFGDVEGFRLRYQEARGDDQALAQLRHRLKPIAHRTLRRQVQKQGAIKFTKRFAITQDFSLLDDEAELYQRLSAFLDSDAIFALNERARHLQTLILRKILASSSFAVTATLERMIARLQETSADDGSGLLDDFEAIGDMADAQGVSQQEAGDLQLQSELETLNELRKLARGIRHNAKANALVTALDKAFAMAAQFGGPRKAVIFTESLRTQRYLADFLGQNGFSGKIALLSGQNADPEAKAIYKSWKARHADSGKLSGSRTADMKAAIVDYFRDHAELLIATESGGEGINLQFCSLIINYDLPWNPQRIEQRIGRVHRYGQQHDVVVVNFLNRSNVADARVLELLGEKLNLFEGVFGASDEVLGAIENSLDIEAEIAEIYAKCRSPDEINNAFDQLQLKFKDSIDQAERQTRQKVLEEFDAEVLQRLSDRAGSITPLLDEHLRFKQHLAAASLDDYQPTDSGFIHKGQHYVLSAEDEDDSCRLFDLGMGLGERLLTDAMQAIDHGSADAELVLSLSSASLQFSDLTALIGQSGHLLLDRITITSGNEATVLLATGISDGGLELDQRQCRRLLELACLRQSASQVETPPKLVQTQAKAVDAMVDQKRRDAAVFFEQENERIERWAEDQRAAHDARLQKLEEALQAARKRLRQVVTLEDKLATKREIKALERERDTAMATFYEQRKDIEAREDEMLESVEARLTVKHSQERLFAVRWTLLE